MLQSALGKILAVVLALAVVVAVALFLIPGSGKKHLTAEFPRTVSLYDGSDVKILGVKVGTVDSVKPAGNKVIVKLSYDDKYKIPDNAKAVLVSPSIVGDRFIQITPAWTSGAVMPNNATLSQKRTATPLELDTIFGSLNDLSIALGPDGVNDSTGRGVGALTRLLDTTSRNFGGQGTQVNSTIKNIARLTQTLSNNKDDLFGATREIEKFVNTLATNDDTVRRFNDSLASGADLLAGERQDLAAALRNLGTALVAVRGFVQDNKQLLGSNIAKLNTLATTLVKRRGQLDEILTQAPLALNNLGLAYNPTNGNLNTRSSLSPVFDSLSKGDLVQVLKDLGCTSTPGSGNANPLCGLVSQIPGTPKASGSNRAGALSPSSKPADPHRFVDPTLAGLVEAHR